MDAKQLFATVLCLSLTAKVAWAQTPGTSQVTRSIQILPLPPFDLVEDLALGGQARTEPEPGGGPSFLKINLIVGCYGRNLRSLRNSVSPESEIKMGLGLGPAPGMPVELVFPGYLVKGGKGYGNDSLALRGAFPPGSDYVVDPGFGLDYVPLAFANLLPGENRVTGAVAYGNVIKIQTDIPVSDLITFNAQGGFSPSAKNNLITYLNFIQNVTRTNSVLNLCQNEGPSRKTWREKTASWIGRHLFPAAQAGGDGTFPVGQDGGGDGSAANFNHWNEGFIRNPNAAWVPIDAVAGSPYAAKCENRIRLPAAGVPKLKDKSQYVGIDGPLNFQYIPAWASNFSSLELFVSFPGEQKFCGGFVSPLMLFTDGRRPRFSGASDMMNRPDPGQSAWVEANAPGVFLALDRNKNGRIDDATELFGEDELAPNGFENLRQYDENQDGVIDSKDRIFKSLLYFRDKNGNGRSDAGEISSAAASGLVSISLSYKINDIKEYAQGLVSAREESRFRFRDPSGRIRNGEVIDVWFGRK